MFWAGEKAKTAHEAKLDDVKGLIAKRDWQVKFRHSLTVLVTILHGHSLFFHRDNLDKIVEFLGQTLRKNDELCRELDAGRVFAGFTDCIDWEKVRTLQLIIRFSSNNQFE